MKTALRISIAVIVALSLSLAVFEWWHNRNRPTFASMVNQHARDGVRIAQLESENAVLREQLKSSVLVPVAHPATRPHRNPTFTLNPLEPVDRQLAEHPGKTPRSPVPGYLWQRMHERDVAEK